MENPANVMTLNNQVMFCGDAQLANYSANASFAALSDEGMFPTNVVVIPVCVTSESQTRLTYLTVQTNGELSLPFDYNEATVHLNGIQFTANSKYYTPEIGNIYNNGTSPLSDT